MGGLLQSKDSSGANQQEEQAGDEDVPMAEADPIANLPVPRIFNEAEIEMVTSLFREHAIGRKSHYPRALSNPFLMFYSQGSSTTPQAGPKESNGAEVHAPSRPSRINGTAKPQPTPKRVDALASPSTSPQPATGKKRKMKV
jgi:hypothetical protein